MNNVLVEQLVNKTDPKDVLFTIYGHIQNEEVVETEGSVKVIRCSLTPVSERDIKRLKPTLELISGCKYDPSQVNVWNTPEIVYLGSNILSHNSDYSYDPKRKEFIREPTIEISPTSKYVPLLNIIPLEPDQSEV